MKHLVFFKSGASALFFEVSIDTMGDIHHGTNKSLLDLKLVIRDHVPNGPISTSPAPFQTSKNKMLWCCSQRQCGETVAKKNDQN
jgi:hypothetical protein